MAAASPVIASLEHGPRRTLFWGGGLLVAGLALVGVGAQDEGAVVALLGLFLTIYGIHTFGRLGEEDRPAAPPLREAAEDPEAALAVATNKLWSGALICLAGLAVTISSYLAASKPGDSVFLAYGAILGGAAQAFRGFRGRALAQGAQAKVEKRRRLGKSPRP